LFAKSDSCVSSIKAKAGNLLVSNREMAF
jgi:hypothetical protein